MTIPTFIITTTSSGTSPKDHDDDTFFHLNDDDDEISLFSEESSASEFEEDLEDDDEEGDSDGGGPPGTCTMDISNQTHLTSRWDSSSRSHQSTADCNRSRQSHLSIRLSSLQRGPQEANRSGTHRGGGGLSRLPRSRSALNCRKISLSRRDLLSASSHTPTTASSHDEEEEEATTLTGASRSLHTRTSTIQDHTNTSAAAAPRRRGGRRTAPRRCSHRSIATPPRLPSRQDSFVSRDASTSNRSGGSSIRAYRAKQKQVTDLDTKQDKMAQLKRMQEERIEVDRRYLAARRQDSFASSTTSRSRRSRAA